MLVKKNKYGLSFSRLFVFFNRVFTPFSLFRGWWGNCPLVCPKFQNYHSTHPTIRRKSLVYLLPLSLGRTTDRTMTDTVRTVSCFPPRQAPEHPPSLLWFGGCFQASKSTFVFLLLSSTNKQQSPCPFLASPHASNPRRRTSR